MSNGSETIRSSCPSGKISIVTFQVPAIILFPALLTPEIIVGSEYIQLLLLGSKGTPILVQNVNCQLKITAGLDEKKSFRAKPLFDENAEAYIKIGDPVDISDAIIGTATNFKGRLDPRALKLYKDWKFDQVYQVNITNSFMKAKGLYNLFWLYKAYDGANPGIQTLNLAIGDKVVPSELHDHVVRAGLADLNGKKIAESGDYCFKVREKDVDVSAIDPGRPVQTYHPVFYYESLPFANIGEIADIHLNARQNVLARSPARVIEYTMPPGKKQEDHSPEIGKCVNVSSRNAKELLGKLGADPQVHVVVIAGDLIDYIDNLYCTKTPTKVKEIWDEVALDGFEGRYQNNVDYISFYSIIVDFYKTYQKPAFVVTGNHDCYNKPYGISPRVTLGSLEIKKANEGVPADHNLTIYESILIFGKTYGKITDTKMFVKDNFKWYYYALTPFYDYMHVLPGQCLIGMSWGEEEDVLGIVPWDYGQGILGHLPRSDNAISDKQLELLELAIVTKKHVIVLTHFTFVSYIEQIPFNTKDEGDVEFDWAWDAGKHDMGTFETNRKKVYEEFFAKKRSIRVTLSGHSHRKGVYSINRADYAGDNSVKTFVLNYGDFVRGGIPAPPAIIVTDSAGPLPRVNYYGEFKGWGSDRASAAKLTFGADGLIKALESVQGGPKPRFPVALDYYDIIEDEQVITKFETPKFPIRDEEMNRYHYEFKIVMADEIANLAYLNKVTLHSFGSDKKWYAVDLRYEGSTGRWVIREHAAAATFYWYFTRKNGERSNFISMKFSPRKSYISQYDFDSRWNFEITVDKDKSGGGLFGSATHKKYIIKRDSDYAEKPDLEWRKKFDKYK